MTFYIRVDGVDYGELTQDERDEVVAQVHSTIQESTAARAPSVEMDNPERTVNSLPGEHIDDFMTDADYEAFMRQLRETS